MQWAPLLSKGKKTVKNIDGLSVAVACRPSLWQTFQFILSASDKKRHLAAVKTQIPPSRWTKRTNWKAKNRLRRHCECVQSAFTHGSLDSLLSGFFVGSSSDQLRGKHTTPMWTRWFPPLVQSPCGAACLSLRSLASIILYTSLSSGTPASFSQHWVLKISKKVIRGCRVAASRLVSTAHVQLSTEMRERRDVSLLSNFRYHRHKNKKTMHLIQNFTGQDMNITNVSPWSSSCTESLSALQRSGVWIRPVAICCMSSVSFHFLSFL